MLIASGETAISATIAAERRIEESREMTATASVILAFSFRIIHGPSAELAAPVSIVSAAASECATEYFASATVPSVALIMNRSICSDRAAESVCGKIGASLPITARHASLEYKTGHFAKILDKSGRDTIIDAMKSPHIRASYPSPAPTINAADSMTEMSDWQREVKNTSL